MRVGGTRISIARGIRWGYWIRGGWMDSRVMDFGTMSSIGKAPQTLKMLQGSVAMESLAEMWAEYKSITGQTQLADPVLEAARQKAVADAWKLEREAVKRGRRGTRNWSDAEKAELSATGKVKGHHGHHINSVNDLPEMAGNPSNIEFVTPEEHLQRHGGNWRNPTEGPTVK